MCKKCKLLLGCVFLLLCISETALCVQADWQRYGNDWYYQDQDGNWKTGWLNNKGAWYYLNADGIMQTGWLKSGGAWYYLDADGKMHTGWIKDKGAWYYLDADGKMKTGWLKDGGAWYYLDAGGKMKTGWLKSGGFWYYLTAGGAMKRGWLKDQNAWYFLESSGAMHTGWLQDNGNWYFLEKNGKMHTGWLQRQANRYFLDSSGRMKTGWLKDGGDWYYLDASGKMHTGWLEKGENRYYLDTDGKMKTGWLKTKDGWYYLNENGKVHTGWKKIEEEWYYFEKDGKMHTGWFENKNGTYYLDAEGKMLTGWQYLEYSIYYFNSNGRLNEEFSGTEVREENIFKGFADMVAGYEAVVTPHVSGKKNKVTVKASAYPARVQGMMGFFNTYEEGWNAVSSPGMTWGGNWKAMTGTSSDGKKINKFNTEDLKPGDILMVLQWNTARIQMAHVSLVISVSEDGIITMDSSGNPAWGPEYALYFTYRGPFTVEDNVVSYNKNREIEYIIRNETLASALAAASVRAQTDAAAHWDDFCEMLVKEIPYESSCCYMGVYLALYYLSEG